MSGLAILTVAMAVPLDPNKQMAFTTLGDKIWLNATNSDATGYVATEQAKETNIDSILLAVVKKRKGLTKLFVFSRK